jgi:DDE superfamily endonuclease
MSSDEEDLESFLIAELLDSDSTIKRSCRQSTLFTHRKETGHFHSTFNHLLESGDDKFKEYYRMTIKEFEELFTLVESSISGPSVKNDTRKICKKERLSVTLRYLTSGQSMRSISLEFLISRSTLSLIIPNVCEAIWASLKPFVFEPLTSEKFKQVAQGFADAGRIPHCIGAIDGKHVKIQAFNGSGSTMFNYKKTFSVVLLAICDSEYKFLYVDVGAHGSESDGGIWRRSRMGIKFYDGTLDFPPPQPLPGSSVIAPFCFVGDDAFGAHQNLLTPYGGNQLSFKQINFNHHQSATRNIIERCFGVLTKRFRIFNTTIAASEETVKKTIKACVAIHNFLMMKRPKTSGKSRISLETDQENDGYEFSPQESREIFAEYLKNNVYTTRVEVTQ